MKNKLWIAGVLTAAALMIGTGCEQRSMPTANPTAPSDSNETANPSIAPHEDTDADKTSPDSDEGSSISSESDENQREEQVIRVAVFPKDSKEAVFQTEDDVLTQRFHDSIYIVNKTHENPISSNYNVELSMKTGETVHCTMQLDPSSDAMVLVEKDGAVWELPAYESDWLRLLIS